MTSAGCDAALRSEPAAPPAEETPQTGSEVAAPVAPLPKELPAILARVNNEAVERWEVETALREIEIGNVHPIPSSQRAEMTRAVLDRIIAHHLVAQEARARKLQVSEADVDADIERIRTEFPSEQAFDEALTSFRTSREQLRRQRRLSLEVAGFVRATITPSVSVSSAEVDGYYRDNLERFQQPETVRASHIFVRTLPGATEEEKAAARAKAVTIRNQLSAGADFAKLAGEQSEDPGSAAQGGNLGTFPRGQMDPSFDAAVFALEVNGLSDIVETGFGFHVVKVHERHAAVTAPLETVRGDIRELLLDRGQQEKLDAFVEQAKAKATIEIYI
jgi:peptidyl-prolyl cis-trans isomerase C